MTIVFNHTCAHLSFSFQYHLIHRRHPRLWHLVYRSDCSNKVFCCSREKGYQGIIDAPWVEGTTLGTARQRLLHNKHIEFSWTFTSSRSLKIEALLVSFCPFASAIIQLSTLTRLSGRRLMTPTEISEPRQIVWHWRTLHTYQGIWKAWKK